MHVSEDSFVISVWRKETSLQGNINRHIMSLSVDLSLYANSKPNQLSQHGKMTENSPFNKNKSLLATVPIVV